MPASDGEGGLENADASGDGMSGMMRIRIAFGQAASLAERDGERINVSLAAPVLGGVPQFSFSLPEGQTHQERGLLVHDSGSMLFGFLRGTPGVEIEAATAELYDKMLRSVGDRFLYRVWHFVPRINQWDQELENYRLFCRGRADSFSRLLGPNDLERLSAASAVGSIETEPVMFFAAGQEKPLHAENPEQVPAYRYPPTYGPRAPSFARATRVKSGEAEAVFISGTASIKGSETVHPNDCEKQVHATLHNLSLIGEKAGLGTNLGRSSGRVRRFVIYLRRAEDFGVVDAILREKLFHPNDEKVFLLADICRADLMVEIEATVLVPPS